MISADEKNEIYEDVILDHYKRPRHNHEMHPCDICQEGKNPLCGDQLNIYLRYDDAKGLVASFKGHGCSISQASASIMVEAINGKSKEECEALIRQFETSMREDRETGDPDSADFSDIDALAGVRKFPVRIKCASLAWKALGIALQGLEKGPNT